MMLWWRGFRIVIIPIIFFFVCTGSGISTGLQQKGLERELAAGGQMELCPIVSIAMGRDQMVINNAAAKQIGSADRPASSQRGSSNTELPLVFLCNSQ